MTQYELPDGFHPIDSIPNKGKVNIAYANGEFGTIDVREKAYSDWERAGWAPIVPLKAKRWRAKMGEPYYIVANGRAQVDRHTDSRDSTDEQLYELGNYFQTKQEAEAMAVKVKALYNEVMP